MEEFQTYLNWINGQTDEILSWLSSWAAINTHTLNLPGLRQQSRELEKVLQTFASEVGPVDISPLRFVDNLGDVQSTALAPALTAAVRPEAPIQILLLGHMDTSYTADQAQNDPAMLDEQIFMGQGVLDAKGGIAIMLKALQAFEQCPWKDQLGWRVFLNSDEQIGSPGSWEVIAHFARKHHLGLVYQPCLSDGRLVGARKGSGNFSLVIKGRAAHVAGDNGDLGRNALYSLAKGVCELTALNDPEQGIHVNVGIVQSGKSVNIVPDLAIARFNVRMLHMEDQEFILSQMNTIAEKLEKEDGVHAQLYGDFLSPPKPLDVKTLQMLQGLADCANDLNFDLKWVPSSSVCDGNRLAAAGLCNVDTLGPIGGYTQNGEEYIRIDSMSERCRLTCLYLMKLAKEGLDRA